MDSLIASYQSAVKDDADAVREVQRLLQDALAAAAEKDRQAQDAIRGAWLGRCRRRWRRTPGGRE